MNRQTRKYTLVIEGDSEGDFDEALGECLSRIKAGNVAGGDRSETSAFYFDSTDSVAAAELPAR